MGLRHSGSRPAAVAFAALTLAIGVSACGGGGNGQATVGAAKNAGTVKVGVLLGGPKNDKSFNQAAYEGVLAAQQANGTLKLSAVLENRVTAQSATDAIDTLAPVNKVVVAVGADFGPIIDVEAPKFPSTYFINVAGYTPKFHKNVTGFANDWGAPAYVAGVDAANLTKSNTVGYLGGAEIPPSVQAANAYVAGVKSVNPKIKILKNIVGSFDDVAKAKAAAAAMIADGADVIFPFLDSGVAGAYAAGRESGKDPAMFKLTIPSCSSYGNIVGTEVVNGAATSKMLDQYVAGTLKPGSIFLDLQDPQLQTLKLCPKYQKNAKIAKATKDAIDAINSGRIKLPANAVNPRPSYPYREGFAGSTVNP